MATLKDTAHDLLFGVRRSVRYHNKRRMFFDRLNNLSNILSALSGSATIISLLAESPPAVTITFASLVAILAAVNLVLGTSQSSRLHHDLANRFLSLEKSITAGDMTNQKTSELIGARLDIEAEEPPPLRVLDSICHNELTKAMGYNKDVEVKISPFQRFFADFFDINPHLVR